MGIAKVGEAAPPFSALAYDPQQPNDRDKIISLADYSGQWLLFFWYPADFTVVCPTEINAFADRIDEFVSIDCAILGSSTDSVHSHRAWASVPREQNGIAGLTYPLLADRTHSIARDYDVLVEGEGVALRGLFIIDPEGALQYAAMHNLNIGRSVDETLRVLLALQSGGMCGSDWVPGQETLA